MLCELNKIAVFLILKVTILKKEKHLKVVLDSLKLEHLEV